jgi:hypothetical protein
VCNPRGKIEKQFPDAGALFSAIFRKATVAVEAEGACGWL